MSTDRIGSEPDRGAPGLGSGGPGSWVRPGGPRQSWTRTRRTRVDPGILRWSSAGGSNRSGGQPAYATGSDANHSLDETSPQHCTRA
ncbi:hypothetical protein QJS10_CPA05g02253 [Acorus calamus]|uniref:Uncharacterized protein n=1 Tax=Acorus calamus TaxID=4465 RepID=A0AAV9EUV6_ACOCL|nr:hypothetical protein QJS10_CPA05g02253 [Acorus calamus]